MPQLRIRIICVTLIMPNSYDLVNTFLKRNRLCRILVFTCGVYQQSAGKWRRTNCPILTRRHWTAETYRCTSGNISCLPTKYVLTEGLLQHRNKCFPIHSTIDPYSIWYYITASPNNQCLLSKTPSIDTGASELEESHPMSWSNESHFLLNRVEFIS